RKISFIDNSQLLCASKNNSTIGKNHIQIPTPASTFNTKITQLSNGIRVASEDTPGHFSAIGVYVDAGSRYETNKYRGVSHILDRLAFKVRAYLEDRSLS